jgi:hypothetical protein
LSAATIAGVSNWNSESSGSLTTWGSELGTTSPDTRSTDDKDSLLREDTPLTQLRGRFRPSGDRILFTEEGANRSMKCLENLWLQRIMDSQKNEDRKVIWMVNSARVTEFNGENYLLIESATKTR